MGACVQRQLDRIGMVSWLTVTLELLGRCRPHPFEKLELSSETGPVGTFKVHPKEALRTQFVPKGRKEE